MASWIHPVIPGWLFCTGSYAVAGAAPTAACRIFSRDNLQSTFRISFPFGSIDGPDLYIAWFDFCWFSPWPWPWIFKVKYGICCISAKKGRLSWSEKADITTKYYASNVTVGLDFGHDLDLEFSRSSILICYVMWQNDQVVKRRKINVTIER